MDLDNIIVLAKEGNEGAFHQLYEKYREKIYLSAFRYARSKEDAEDIMQETFIKAFKNIHQLESLEELVFAAWLQTICSRTALNHLKRKKRRSEDNMEAIGMNPKSKQPSPEIAFQNKADMGLVRDCYQKLSPKQQIIFNMRFEQHLQIKEIASQLGCSESNVKTQIKRSMEKLQKALKPLWRK